MKKLLAALVALTLMTGCLPVLAESVIGNGATVDGIIPIGSGATVDGIIPIGSGATVTEVTPIGGGTTVNETMPSHSSNYGFMLSGGTLYSAPGGGSVVTTISDEDVVLYDGVSGTNTADGTLWVRVITKGTSGYVPVSKITFMTRDEEAAYWKMLNPDPTPTPTPVPTAQPVPTPTPLVTIITPAPGDKVIGKAQVTTASGSLNLRQLPSYSAGIIGYIPQYAVVDVFEYDGGWARIRYSGVTGWVLRSFLTDYNAQPVPTPTPLVTIITPAPGDKVIGKAQVTTASGSLNLRQLPSYSAGIIGYIPQYAVVDVFEYDGGWARIRYSGVTGWVLRSFLTDYNAQPTCNPYPTANPGVLQGYAYVRTNGGGLNMREYASTAARVTMVIPRYARVEVYSYGNSWCYIHYNGLAGYVMTSYLSFAYTPTPTATPAPVQPTLPPVQGYAYVSTNGGGLNMREYASTAARVTMVIPRYARVEIFSYGSTWAWVRYMGVSGYVMTRYLSTGGVSPAPTAAPTAGSWATVATQSGGLNIREATYVGSRILKVAPKGATVSVLERGTTWSRISYGGVTGYAMTGFLNFGGGTASVTSSRAIVSASGNGLKLYTSASTASSALCTIPARTEVNVLSRGERWTYVNWGSYTGYVLTTYLTFLPD